MIISDYTVNLTKNILHCPICGEPLKAEGNSVMCFNERRHTFDFSSNGYLNLAPFRGNTGDSKEAVAARHKFLLTEAYHDIADGLNTIINKYIAQNGFIIDAGCGEGYYTERIASNGSYSVCGFDLSKYGCDVAAKSAKRNNIHNVFYAVANIYDLPVNDKTADCVFNVFAPCAFKEFGRVLKNGGYLIVIGAGENHLIDLKKLIYDNVYTNTERDDLPTESDGFKQVERVKVSYRRVIEGNDNIKCLFSMTPYYWRTAEQDKRKLDAINNLETMIEAEIIVYKYNDKEQGELS